jgi:hypothetical protein
MNDAKYIGMDVHQATVSVAVRDSGGKLVMEAILETKAETILQFVRGLRGSLHVTFEEGTCAAWLYALLKPHVTQVLVCDPRKNALLKVGNKNDRIDSRKLAELLRANLLSSVFHEDTGLRAVKELARSYLTMTKDLTRVMVRLKALYRSWAIPCATKQVYAPRHRAEWLAKIREASVHRRAELYYQQLDALRSLQQQVKKELLIEGRKHEVAASDPFDRSHSSSASTRAHPDTAPFPYQTTIVELLRPGFGDPHQCGIPRGARTTPAIQETRSHSRAQQKP